MTPTDFSCSAPCTVVLLPWKPGEAETTIFTISTPHRTQTRDLRIFTVFVPDIYLPFHTPILKVSTGDIASISPHSRISKPKSTLWICVSTLLRSRTLEQLFLPPAFPLECILYIRWATWPRLPTCLWGGTGAVIPAQVTEERRTWARLSFSVNLHCSYDFQTKC